MERNAVRGVNAALHSGQRAQLWSSSVSGQAAMSTLWFSGDARVHHWGACEASATRPPASRAAATRALA